MARESSKLPGNMPAPTRIRKFHSGDNVHAQLHGYDVNMRNIGGISVGQGQSPHMCDLSVSTEIGLGSVRVPFNGRTYEWSMSGVTIAVEFENANIIPGSYYRHVLQEGGYEAAERDEDKTTANSDRSGEISAEIGAGFSGVPWWKALVRGKGSTRCEKKHDSNASSNTKISPIVILVERTGDGILRAEDQSRGRLRPVTRDLRGTIVNTHLRRESNEKKHKIDIIDESPTPLVRLEAIDPNRPVLGLISVRAEKEDFVINASKDHEEEAKLLEQALGSDKSAWLRRRNAAERDLRQRIAALSALRGFYVGDGNRAGAQEFDLFCCPFCFEPEADGKQAEPETES